MQIRLKAQGCTVVRAHVLWSALVRNDVYVGTCCYMYIRVCITWITLLCRRRKHFWARANLMTFYWKSRVKLNNRKRSRAWSSDERKMSFSVWIDISGWQLFPVFTISKPSVICGVKISVTSFCLICVYWDLFPALGFCFMHNGLTDFASAAGNFNNNIIIVIIVAFITYSKPSAP